MSLYLSLYLYLSAFVSFFVYGIAFGFEFIIFFVFRTSLTIPSIGAIKYLRGGSYWKDNRSPHMNSLLGRIQSGTLLSPVSLVSGINTKII